ncbi:accessory factor UbiK family protein [Candidatus Spongiihabitans sp.]|uniref:accessory factor UbiK family protein n=1 Tax=Candidatus Spongiihabitans sp. TaxID=3101308 RepID=UPI003C7E402A
MRDKIRQAIQAVLPPELAAEVKNNIDAVVKSNFEKMNLVTREQLEIQEKILMRTRQRIIELEQQVKEMEARLKVE